MLFLVLSIVCSVSVSVLMKLARKHQIDVSQAVAVNYWVAIAWTLLVSITWGFLGYWGS